MARFKNNSLIAHRVAGMRIALLPQEAIQRVRMARNIPMEQLPGVIAVPLPSMRGSVDTNSSVSERREGLHNITHT